jgi:RNA-directed DNA polymerase
MKPVAWWVDGGTAAVKRVGHLFEDVTSYENLLAAFRLARRGSGNAPAVGRFFFHLERELLRLQAELEAGSYQPGAYQYFTIYDPKERVIAVAPFRDRVVHHALVRVLTPIYERVFIFDSYATRPGKGTHAAIGRAQQFLRRWMWYLQTDIAKYFDRVDHDTLLDLLRRKLKDRRLLNLLERIIRNTSTPGTGLPIGNLTSQFLANVYLDPLDHDLKDRLGLRGYVRYMDDMACFSDSKAALQETQTRMEEFLRTRLALSLKPSATRLNRASHGLSFLGMRIFRQAIRVKPENRRRSLRRLRQAIQAWKQNEITEEQMQQSLISIVGHLRYFCPKQTSQISENL